MVLDSMANGTPIGGIWNLTDWIETQDSEYRVYRDDLAKATEKYNAARDSYYQNETSGISELLSMVGLAKEYFKQEPGYDSLSPHLEKQPYQALRAKLSRRH
ncbi:hypothetical protein ABW19_dt0207237 [Dactylella cylindrospora]|nr:hypothetical protein ABW19_dt0207237 [Dactylella cylindrospora]